MKNSIPKYSSLYTILFTSLSCLSRNVPLFLAAVGWPYGFDVAAKLLLFFFDNKPCIAESLSFRLAKGCYGYFLTSMCLIRHIEWQCMNIINVFVSNHVCGTTVGVFWFRIDCVHVMCMAISCFPRMKQFDKPEAVGACRKSSRLTRFYDWAPQTSM